MKDLTHWLHANFRSIVGQIERRQSTGKHTLTVESTGVADAPRGRVRARIKLRADTFPMVINEICAIDTLS